MGLGGIAAAARGAKKMVNDSPDASQRDNLRGQLIAVFSEQAGRISEDIGYYHRLACQFHLGSRALLIAAVITFGFGSLAPFLRPIWPKHDWLSWGYAALVVAGLLIGVERAFLASQGWSRFILAEMRLKALRNSLAIEQRKFELTTADDPAAKGRVETITELVATNEQKRASIVEDETKAWASELAAALADFAKGVATATAEAVKTHAERDAAAAGSGVVKVDLADAPKDAGRIIVSLGGVQRDIAMAMVPKKLLVFENQSPGPRAVRVRWQQGNSWREIEEVVVVKPGEEAPVTITFPRD